MFTEKTLRASVVLKKLLHFDLMIYGFPVCAKFNTARRVLDDHGSFNLSHERDFE